MSIQTRNYEPEFGSDQGYLSTVPSSDFDETSDQNEFQNVPFKS